MSIEAEPDSLPVVRQISQQLESLRRLLIHSPAALSVESTGSLLQSLNEGLAVIQSRLEQGSRPSVTDRSEIIDVIALAGRVNALYRQAASFYTAVAGPPAGACYTYSGEVAPKTLHHILVEG